VLTDKSLNIDAFKLITTGHHLILRPHRESDASFMVELNSNPAVTAHTPDGPLPGLDVAEEIIQSLRKQFIERQIGRFIVEDATGKLLGWCGLKWLEETDEIDLGFRFLQETWGKGIATDAAMACLTYGFAQLHFPRITAKVLPANLGSVKVLQKIGMKEVRRIAEDDMEYCYFQITNNEFKARS
jgi:[ribosomal protein S5]-alanine N-acetyltransferase